LKLIDKLKMLLNSPWQWRRHWTIGELKEGEEKIELQFFVLSVTKRC